MMRIIHINCNYLDTWLHQLMIESLLTKHVDSKIFVPVYRKEGHIVIPNNNVIVSECFNKYDRIIYEYKQKKIYSAARKSIKFEKYDCIHAYTLFTDGNIARRISEEYGLPYIVAVRNTDVNTFYKYRKDLKGLALKIMLGASKIIFLSEAYLDKVLNEYVPKKFKNIIMEKSVVIPNGIDKYWLDNKFYTRNYKGIKSEHNNKHIRLIYAGSIDKNKNIHTTCKAIDILEKKGYKIEFTVIGKITDNKEFIKIKDKVHYHNPETKDKLINYYREADIFVMPSIKESFGLVYAEAMSQGLPVIYSKGQGFDRQFPEATVGLHVNSRDPESIEKAIVTIINDYFSISRNCLDMCEKFDWDTITDKYVSIYQQSISGKID